MTDTLLRSFTVSFVQGRFGPQTLCRCSVIGQSPHFFPSIPVDKYPVAELPSATIEGGFPPEMARVAQRSFVAMLVSFDVLLLTTKDRFRVPATLAVP